MPEVINIYDLSVHVKANGWVKLVITVLTLSDSLSSEIEQASPTEPCKP